MKYLVASDIHGCAACCGKLIERIAEEEPDKILLLGDILYHGPRNDLPAGYAPKEVIAMLNPLAERIVAVRGNCDAEVDQMVLDFPCMADFALVGEGERMLFLTHGHVFGPDRLPATEDLPESELGTRAATALQKAQLETPGAFVVLSGHTHVKTDYVREGVRYVNPGSLSIPKDGTNSFAVVQDGEVVFKDLEGTVLTL